MMMEPALHIEQTITNAAEEGSAASAARLPAAQDDVAPASDESLAVGSAEGAEAGEADAEPPEATASAAALTDDAAATVTTEEYGADSPASPGTLSGDEGEVPSTGMEPCEPLSEPGAVEVAAGDEVNVSSDEAGETSEALTAPATDAPSEASPASAVERLAEIEAEASRLRLEVESLRRERRVGAVDMALAELRAREGLCLAPRDAEVLRHLAAGGAEAAAVALAAARDEERSDAIRVDNFGDSDGSRDPGDSGHGRADDLSPEALVARWLQGFLRAGALRVPLGENGGPGHAADAWPASRHEAGSPGREVPPEPSPSPRTDSRSVELHRRAMGVLRREPRLAYAAALARASAQG